MKREIRAAVLSNDKAAKKEMIKIRSGEEDEGLLHTDLIWPNHHGVAGTICSIHI
jgi:hypothetical protein